MWGLNFTKKFDNLNNIPMRYRTEESIYDEESDKKYKNVICVAKRDRKDISGF